MADRIKNNMIAWAGEKPWHGKGFAVDLAKLAAMATAEEKIQYWLDLASMNFMVQRRMLAMRNAVGSQDVLLTDPLENFRAIVRADTDEVFQVATKRYQPLQNREIVEFFMHYCEAGHATMETLGAIDGGSKIFCLAKLNGGTETFVQAGGKQGGKGTMIDPVDKLQGYMLIATSHDGSLRTIGKPTQIRVVCWNTLSMALWDNSGGDGKSWTKQPGVFAMKHSRKWTPAVADEARKVMGMAIESVSKMNETAQTLARVKIDEKGRMEFVKRLLGGETILEQVTANTYSDAATASGKGLLDAVVQGHQDSKADEPEADLNRVGKSILEAMLTSPGSDLPTAKDTLWGAVNGVTYYVDHERGRSQDNRLSGAWFGTGDTMKRDAVKVALDMAGKG